MAYIGQKPADKPLSASDLEDGLITNSKLAQDIISAETELATAPADTDEFLISDAGTLKRIDASLVGGGGITEADMFRLTADTTGDIDPLASNIERVDDATFSKIGTGITNTSGTFSFPSTGLYLVQLHVTFFGNANADSNVNALITGTANNSSYDNLALAQCGVDQSHNKKQEATTQTFFNCTDVSTHKIRFKTTSMNSNNILGDTDINYTIFSFIRLGDSQ